MQQPVHATSNEDVSQHESKSNVPGTEIVGPGRTAVAVDHTIEHSCIFASCPNEGLTKLSIATGKLRYAEKSGPVSGGRMNIWVCDAHIHSEIAQLAVSWDGERVEWDPD